MKKHEYVRKISLNHETIRSLTTKGISLVRGGVETVPSENSGCKTCG
jgi:hypothetical protein